MENWRKKCFFYFRDWSFLKSFFWSWIFLVVSLVGNFYAAVYAAERASNPVTDIILNNIRVYDVDTIFIYGPILLFIFLGYLLLVEPQKLPFVLKSISLFVVIRSGFITLTHIGPFPTHLVLDPESFITHFTTGNDLFFSAHTGLPFLLALIFWQNRRLRPIFIGCSILFGAVVLLGHLHYSIDVMSAFFITFTIYHLAKYFFVKDKAFFDSRCLPLANLGKI
jgi:hypothetical protein